MNHTAGICGTRCVNKTRIATISVTVFNDTCMLTGTFPVFLATNIGNNFWNFTLYNNHNYVKGLSIVHTRYTFYNTKVRLCFLNKSCPYFFYSLQHMDHRCILEDMHNFRGGFEPCKQHQQHNRKDLHISHFYKPYHLDIQDLTNILFVYKYHKDFLYILLSKYILVCAGLLNTLH